MTPGAQATPRTRRHPAVLVGVLCGVQFLAVLDSLAVALALPAIGRDLGLSTTGLSWVLNSTSVSLAGGLLVAGRLGDMYGRRPMFVVGLVLLTAGAAAAGSAGTPAVLLVGRVLQGLGAAVAYPSALALLGESFPDEPWRSRAFAGMSVSGASATVSGVVFGGVATSLLGWQWVFWPTVPVGLVLLAVGVRVLPAAGPRQCRGLDLPGAALSTSALVSLVATVVHGGETQRLDRGVLVGAGATVLLLLGFVAWERVATDPLLPGALLRSAPLRGGSAGMASDSALYSAIAFITALQLHEQLGLTSAQTGAALLPMSLGIVATGTLLAPRLRRRYGSVRLTGGGLLIGAAALAWLAVASAAPSYVRDVLPALLLLGAALSLATIGAMEHGLGAGDGADRGVASGVLETSTHVGGAVSVACYASVLAAGADPFLLAYLTAACFGVAGAVAVAATSRRPVRRPVRRPADGP